MQETIKYILTDKMWELLKLEIGEKAYRTGRMFRAVRKDPRKCQVWIDETRAPYAFYVNYGTRYMRGRFFVEQAVSSFENFVRSREWKAYLEGLFERTLGRGFRS